MVNSGQLKQLETDFKSCKSISNPLDQQVFAENLAGNFQGVVQYNKEVPGMDIEDLCEYMTSTSDPYQGLINLNNVRFSDITGNYFHDHSCKTSRPFQPLRI